jgi:hypothetical protein
MGEAVLTAEDNGTALMDGEQLQSARQIMSESGIDALRIMFRFKLSFIDANKFLSFPGFFPKTVIRDPVEPGGKTRLTPEAAKVFIGPEKGLLREVVRERNIGPDQLPKQTANSRLMIPHQLRKRVVVVVNKNACNEICI